MEDRKVPLYPISNMEVRVNAEKGLVMINLPYFTGFNTAEQKEHHDHSYALLEEHAQFLRKFLDDALQQIAEVKQKGN